MGLLSLTESAVKNNYLFDSNLEITEGISLAKRGLRVVKEKEDFAFLKYYIHHQNLKEHTLKTMN